jgi:hypothetical protein
MFTSDSDGKLDDINKTLCIKIQNKFAVMLQVMLHVTDITCSCPKGPFNKAITDILGFYLILGKRLTILHFYFLLLCGVVDLNTTLSPLKLFRLISKV